MTNRRSYVRHCIARQIVRSKSPHRITFPGFQIIRCDHQPRLFLRLAHHGGAKGLIAVNMPGNKA
jgi:hypothetical protein